MEQWASGVKSGMLHTNGEIQCKWHLCIGGICTWMKQYVMRKTNGQLTVDMDFWTGPSGGRDRSLIYEVLYSSWKLHIEFTEPSNDSQHMEGEVRVQDQCPWLVHLMTLIGFQKVVHPQRQSCAPAREVDWKDIVCRYDIIPLTYWHLVK